jgi:hypothetical protein
MDGSSADVDAADDDDTEIKATDFVSDVLCDATSPALSVAPSHRGPSEASTF